LSFLSNLPVIEQKKKKQQLASGVPVVVLQQAGFFVDFLQKSLAM
jgi:hypothetical protein